MAEFDTPQSRNEAILQNILGASNDLEPPQSRIEVLLLALLEELGGGGSEEVPKVFFYGSATPSTNISDFPGIKHGDMCYCYVSGSKNSSTGVYMCLQITTTTVVWRRVDNLTAVANQIKAGLDTYALITPSNQHKATFYGMAKAAGDNTQEASANAVGNYTPEAKTKIMNMLGDKYELIDTDTLTEAVSTFEKYINNYESVIITFPNNAGFATGTLLAFYVYLENNSSPYTVIGNYSIQTKKQITVELQRMASDLLFTRYITPGTGTITAVNSVTSGAINKIKMVLTNDTLPSGTTIKIYGKGKV